MANQKYPPQGSYPPEGAEPVNSDLMDDGANGEKEKKGILSTLKKEAEKVGHKIGKGIDAASAMLTETVDKNYTSPLLEQFHTGNVLQLISRVTGRTVQIVEDPDKQLVLDANGPQDPSAFNTLWTCINEGSNQVRLHNFENYVGIIEGQVVIKKYVSNYGINPSGTTQGPESLFQLSEAHQQFVTLESVLEKHEHIGFLATGEIKPALATAKEHNAHLGVNLLSTAYPDLSNK